MAQVDANADIYANKRLNIFFKGVIPSLDGQCVSLAKGFMQDMSSVPNPQAARGDARYVGKTLVAQGHAISVPYANRKRGDIICYEYGQYGHIGVVLSGNRTFEENVNWPGVASKIVAGAKVYASRIGSLSEGWRHDQHIYRLKTYKEGSSMSDAEITKLIQTCWGRSPTAAELSAYRKRDPLDLYRGVVNDPQARLSADQVKKAVQNCWERPATAAEVTQYQKKQGYQQLLGIVNDPQSQTTSGVNKDSALKYVQDHLS